MSQNLDRLYELLPAVYRQKDAEQQQTLKALLRVISGQVNVLEDDMKDLYDNWFIETCDDWVVPYIADLVGYQPVHEAGEPGDATTESGLARNKILIPRSEVANTIRNRRRKGTLSLLELLALDVAKWPARAVEFFPLVSFTQSLNHLQFSRPSYKITKRVIQNLKNDNDMTGLPESEKIPEEILKLFEAIDEQLFKSEQQFIEKIEKLIDDAELEFTLTPVHRARILLRARFEGRTIRRGRTVDLRNGDALSRIDGPFDEIAHTVDVRRPNSRHSPGKYNLPSVGLFIWRLKAYSVTRACAHQVEKINDSFYTFSILGNDIPLFTRSVREALPTQIAGELNVPVPIRRRAMQENLDDYYGEEKSLHIWIDGEPVPAEKIVVAILDEWKQKPPEGKVAVDPETGRIVVNLAHSQDRCVEVSYHYGFSADIGGGEYFRTVQQPTLRNVGELALCDDDFADFKKTVSLFKKHEQPCVHYLFEQFSPELQAQLENADQKKDEGKLAALQVSFIGEVNDLLATQRLDQQTAFKSIDLPAQIKAIAKMNPSGKKLLYLNRVILEACLGTELVNILKIYRVIGPSPEDENSEQVKQKDASHFDNINEALDAWKKDKPRHAIIELADNILCEDEMKPIKLKKNQTLQIRAMVQKCPTLRQTNYRIAKKDGICVEGQEGSRFTFDGILYMGRGIKIKGDLEEFNIRHSTLVPGWTIDEKCNPMRAVGSSIQIENSQVRVDISHSIVGTIEVKQKDVVANQPNEMTISDSILDATDYNLDALSASNCKTAFARLKIFRTTVIGKIFTHAIELAENSIFASNVHVARSQFGCVRFSYVSPGSRTPKRFNCQPDLAVQAAPENLKESEQARVIPQFNQSRFGKPDYCQLAHRTADEIKRGADDESEMGVFHDLFQPQREANIRTRLQEYTPAGMNAGVFFVN